MKVLYFSGGIDSLACLHFMRQERDMCVLTASTDGAYPDRYDYIAKVQAEFHYLDFNFVKTNRDLQQHGYPVDVVPLRYTALGQMVGGRFGVRYQDHFSCCSRSLWMPMHFEAQRIGATEIIRGQRADDDMRAPVRDGEVIDGVTYRFPVQDWTRQSVVSYVEKNIPHLIPESYKLGEATSRDCMDCTAYLKDNAVRLRNLPPVVADRVNSVLRQWRADVVEETRQ
jgi:3'-phosphoadenosine 5'-phosphosulfate sulfotransferase (PAPS reductase)/FAD synthetase